MMKRKLLNKGFASVAFMVICFAADAQQTFNYKAALPAATKSGFYSINLPPQVIAKCSEGLGDIRILDEKGKAAAYILKTATASEKGAAFINFPVINIYKDVDKLTHVTIENIDKKSLGSLALQIKNTAASRTVMLSGSDDNKQWFAIKENIGLDNAYSDNAADFIQTLSFPVTSYRYLQITFLGKNVLPVNIVKAGIYKNNLIEGKYVEVPSPKIVQKDSTDRRSYLKLLFDEPYQLDKINLEITGTKYYKRQLSIYVDNMPDTYTTYTLSSSSNASFIVNAKAKTVLLVVDNGDNTSLKLEAVKAFQLHRSLLAYFDSAKQYHLYFGDSLIAAPNYDLHFFKDSINGNITEITLGSIELNKHAVVNKPLQKNNQWIIWLSIAAALILLLTLTFKMIKEVGNKKESE